jgi:heme/copper-type cytochrome/quinol oxidase subunit 1
MNLEKTGAVISRGIGVGLIILGASSLLYLPLFQPSGAPSSGWTSYSPGNSADLPTDLATHLQDTYFVVSNFAAGYLPSVAQTVAGFVLIFLSRPIGRWLAKGLGEKDADDPA